MTQLKITVLATIRGCAPDLTKYASHLKHEIDRAMDNSDGPDLIVEDVKIEKKLEGFESLT